MKKPLFIILAVIILAGAVVAFLRFGLGGDEDTWICSNGQWVKHGNPSAAKPTTGCGQAETTNQNVNTSNYTNLPVPNVTYATNTDRSPLYVFDTVDEWTSIAPEEIQKSVTAEQRHGYEIQYFASNTDAVTFSVSEKKSTELMNIAAIVADDRSVSKNNTSVTWLNERLGQNDARTELRQVVGTADYTVYSRYLIVSSAGGETRWALAEIGVPAAKKNQYTGVVAHLLDALMLADGSASNVDLSGQFNWSTMNQGPYNDKVTYATSINLTNWTASGKILAEHASVPGAVVKDGTIFAYFVDVSQDGLKEQLGLVKSTDQGLTWSAPTRLTISGLGDKATADPAPVLLADGRIRLFYFDINESRINKPAIGTEPVNTIYSAISNDGINFTQEAGVRFQRQGVFDPDVELVNNTWYMYTGDVESNQVIVATSTDGLTFTEKGVAFSGGAVPDVWYESGTWYLYTAGIGMATSTNGVTFTDARVRFSDPNYQATADPSVVKLANDSYLMLYKVKQ